MRTARQTNLRAQLMHLEAFIHGLNREPGHQSLGATVAATSHTYQHSSSVVQASRRTPQRLNSASQRIAHRCPMEDPMVWPHGVALQNDLPPRSRPCGKSPPSDR